MVGPAAHTLRMMHSPRTVRCRKHHAACCSNTTYGAQHQSHKLTRKCCCAHRHTPLRLNHVAPSCVCPTTPVNTPPTPVHRPLSFRSNPNNTHAGSHTGPQPFIMFKHTTTPKQHSQQCKQTTIAPYMLRSDMRTQG